MNHVLGDVKKGDTMLYSFNRSKLLVKIISILQNRKYVKIRLLIPSNIDIIVPVDSLTHYCEKTAEWYSFNYLPRQISCSSMQELTNGN